MELIKVKNLYKRFSGINVLENVNFTVKSGEFLSIIGENGTGKSTLMRLLLGLIDATKGNIEVNKKIKNKIGYLPQQVDIKADFPASVYEIIMSGFLNSSAIIPFLKKGQKTKANKILEQLHITDIKNKSFKELSGGQKQRVLLGRALAASNGVLLLDEPLNALDPLAIADFFEILEQLKNDGYTIIMISHDIHCAIKYANNILHLSHNSYYYGSTKEYVNSPLGKIMLEEGHHHD